MGFLASAQQGRPRALGMNRKEIRLKETIGDGLSRDHSLLRTSKFLKRAMNEPMEIS